MDAARGAALALAAVAQRPAPPQHGRADRRLHLVQPDRSGRLGHRAVEPRGVVYPVGLFDLNRDPRPVGLSYKHLIDSIGDRARYRECPALKEILK